MTAHSPLESTKNEDLHHRLMILEKFIELKSNECAYYRTKVHLMQMSSSTSQVPANAKRSSSDEISQSSIANPKPSISSSTQRYRTSSMPSSARKNVSQSGTRLSIVTQHVTTSNVQVTQFSHSSIPFNRRKDEPVVPSPTKFRKIRKISAQNQNHYEGNASNEKVPSLLSNPLDQLLSSCINQHLQQALAQKNNDPCNEQGPRVLETPSTSMQTVVIIRLPPRFVKSLVKQQKRSTAPKLKVHISSELLQRLLQTIHGQEFEPKKHHQRMDKFTIQSQFGALLARVERKDISDRQEPKVVYARAEVKAHGECRMPTVRHIARARPDPSDRHSMVRKHRHQRRKKRRTHESSTTSQEETYSKRSSTTGLTQSTRTLPSSN